MKRTLAIAALVFGSMLVSPTANARQTISRPIDNFLGNWLDQPTPAGRTASTAPRTSAGT